MKQQQNAEKNMFAQYFAANVAPLIEENNKLKENYRSRFWGCLWTMMFLICVNALFVLFNTLIYFHPFNIEQLILVTIIAILIVIFPLWQYKKKEKPDFLDVFVKYYGQWQHIMPGEKENVKSFDEILPEHSAQQVFHAVNGAYLGTKIKIEDVEYWQKSKKVSKGVYIEVLWPQNMHSSILLFAKNGYFRKNRRDNMTLLNEQILIPAAAYFNIFAKQAKAPKKFLCSPFFEKVLDLRDAFGARKIYLSLQGDKTIIYMEGSQMYVEQNGIWQHKIKESKFNLLHKQFSEVLGFIELLHELYARDRL